ncbi:MAG: dimethylsulfonioproprionate lyase family protein [Pseudomonadota bacterium]
MGAVVTVLERVYAACGALVAATPALRDFAPWPDTPMPVHKDPVSVPTVVHLHDLFVGARSSQSEIGRSPPEHQDRARNRSPGSAVAEPALPQLHQDVIDATLAAADTIEWRRTYTEAEVGADFLARYGYFELLGPTGHFEDQTTRAYIGYWGPSLHYPWHAHPAEECYYVLAGAADFHIESGSSRCAVGEHQIHTGNQPHAMTVPADGPGLLTFVLWRGAGLGENATMSSAA